MSTTRSTCRTRSTSKRPSWWIRGVTFDFGQGAWLAVHDANGPGTVAGSLKAAGTASNMITFEGNGTPGCWFQIQIMSPDPENILDYVKVLDAGADSSNTVAAVALHGNGIVTVNHSIIGNNKGYAFCNPGGATGDANFTLDSPDSNTYRRRTATPSSAHRACRSPPRRQHRRPNGHGGSGPERTCNSGLYPGTATGSSPHGHTFPITRIDAWLESS